MLDSQFNMYGDGTVAVGVKTFTLAEANRALVLVRRVVGDVVENYHRMLDLQEASEAADSQAVSGALAVLSQRLRSCLDELEHVGVELKDFARGIVDFPAVAGGRMVFLCWRYGEAGILHWHELGETFAERRDIGTLPKIRQTPEPAPVEH